MKCLQLNEEDQPQRLRTKTPNVHVFANKPEIVAVRSSLVEEPNN